MKLRISLIVALVAMMALPTTTLAANPKKAPDPGTTYTREEVPLVDGAVAIYESIVLDGTLLTDEIRTATDWETLAATGVEHPSVTTAEGVVIQATAYKTIGRRFSAFNSLGWLVIQYTVWQEFGYNGTNVTYYPAPTYDHQANWGWTMKSHSETAWWVSNPTHRATRGNFYFKYEVWTPFGNIGWNEKSGWVRVDYYGSGSWTGSNS